MTINVMTKEQREYILALEAIARGAKGFIVLLAEGFGFTSSPAIKKATESIDALLDNRPEMSDLGELEDYRITQKQLYGSIDAPALLYRDRMVGLMRDTIDIAESEGRLLEDEARLLYEGLDYIRGMGQGL